MFHIWVVTDAAYISLLTVEAVLKCYMHVTQPNDMFYLYDYDYDYNYDHDYDYDYACDYDYHYD